MDVSTTLIIKTHCVYIQENHLLYTVLLSKPCIWSNSSPFLLLSCYWNAISKKNKIVIVPRGPLHFLRVALEAAVHMSFILDTDLLFKNTIEENF